MKTILLVLSVFMVINGVCTSECAAYKKETPQTIKGVPTEETPNPLTHGQVQLTLRKGITTQAEVLETFGAPNITTIDASGNEVWEYQRNATVGKSTSSGSYGTIIIAGASKTTTGFEQSSRTMTLIIKFDKTKKVVDFRSMASSF